jgi:hypothetical protein
LSKKIKLINKSEYSNLINILIGLKL